jgi:4-carboxymuconolactone decarboxylase
LKPSITTLIVTIAALISAGNFEQILIHMKKANENGVTSGEFAEMITHYKESSHIPIKF